MCTYTTGSKVRNGIGSEQAHGCRNLRLQNYTETLAHVFYVMRYVRHILLDP